MLLDEAVEAHYSVQKDLGKAQVPSLEPTLRAQVWLQPSSTTVVPPPALPCCMKFGQPESVSKMRLKEHLSPRETQDKAPVAVVLHTAQTLWVQSELAGPC